MKFYLLLYFLILLISSTSIADESVFITCKCKHFYWKDNQELKGTSCDDWASPELNRQNYEIKFNEDGKFGFVLAGQSIYVFEGNKKTNLIRAVKVPKPEVYDLDPSHRSELLIDRNNATLLWTMTSDTSYFRLDQNCKKSEKLF